MKHNFMNMKMAKMGKETGKMKYRWKISHFTGKIREYVAMMDGKRQFLRIPPIDRMRDICYTVITEKATVLEAATNSERR
jgi:hypothetical protein